MVNFNTDACKGQNNEVNFLEHVQLVTDIDYTRRGNLAIYLTSPNGKNQWETSGRSLSNRWGNHRATTSQPVLFVKVQGPRSCRQENGTILPLVFADGHSHRFTRGARVPKVGGVWKCTIPRAKTAMTSV